MSYALEFKPNLIDFTEQDTFLIYNISILHKFRHLPIILSKFYTNKAGQPLKAPPANPLTYTFSVL